MSEREPGMGQEQEPLTGTAALEARWTQLIEAGELQEPDIAGAEAVELVTRCSEMGVALTQEDLKGRALRLTQGELEEIVEGGDWLEWFRGDWRKSFVARGGHCECSISPLHHHKEGRRLPRLYALHSCQGTGNMSGGELVRG